MWHDDELWDGITSLLAVSAVFLFLGFLLWLVLHPVPHIMRGVHVVKAVHLPITNPLPAIFEPVAIEDPVSAYYRDIIEHPLVVNILEVGNGN